MLIINITKVTIDFRFFKGKNTGSTGHFTKQGAFIVDPEKIRRFVIPDLKGFTVKRLFLFVS